MRTAGLVGPGGLVGPAGIVRPAKGDADVGRPCFAPRTAAGERAVRRRRARVAAVRRPPSGLLPSTDRTAAVVSADRGDEAADFPFRTSRWIRLAGTVCFLAVGVMFAVVLLTRERPTVIGEITVGPGDSLWSIAQRAEPGADPRSVIDQIRQLNGLHDDAIAAGVVLKVPVQGG